LVVNVLDFLVRRIGRSVLVDGFGNTFDGIALHFRRWCKNHCDYRYATNFIYDYQFGRLYCLHFISFNLTAPEAFDILASKNYTHFINTDINSKTFFLKTFGRNVHHHCDDGFRPRNDAKTFLSTILKILKKTCSLLRELLVVNLAFLFLGGLLYLFAMQNGAEYFQLLDMVNGKENITNILV
jgi:hypothetical protein